MSWKIRCAVLTLALFLAACTPPETDRERYAVGESGTVSFRNDLRVTLYLGGCGHFDYEKRVGDQWVSQGSDIVCVWEGLAQPVPPGGVVTDPILAREPGSWRLRYAVGIGCNKKRSLSAAHCDRLIDVTSNEFQVVASPVARCVVTGCSGELCVDASLGEVATPCVWLPEYACFRDARCGPFGPGSECAWEPTPELAECLDAAGSR